MSTTHDTTAALPGDSITSGAHLATLNEDDADVTAWGNTLDKTGDVETARHASDVARDAVTLARYALAVLWEVVEGSAAILDTDAEAVHEYAGALACSLGEFTRRRAEIERDTETLDQRAALDN